MREELYEEVRKAVHRLAEESEEDVVVLVEGSRDVRALRMMGYAGRVVQKSRLKAELEDIPTGTRVILLLDFDREGLKNMAKLSKQLAACGYRVDDTYHRKLRVLKHLGVNTVEGIRKLLPALQQRRE